MLQIDLALQNGPKTAIQAAAPRGITGLYGPSGCGKTSLLRAIAGLDPAQGAIMTDGVDLAALPPHRRGVAMVFQDGRLLDHLNVLGNLRFAARRAKSDPAEIIAALDLEPLLAKRPAQLSGGERKRVALGQALLLRPKVLMLDEPLTGLDAARRNDILPYLAALRRKPLVTLLVSHDLSDLSHLADHLWLIGPEGLRRQGDLAQILADPQSAQLLGPRQAGALVEARILGYDTQDDLTQLALGQGHVYLPGHLGAKGNTIRLRIPAHDVILSRAAPNGLSALGHVPVEITSIHPGRGPGLIIGLRTGSVDLLARITRRSAREMQLRDGMALHALIKATAIAPADAPRADMLR